MSVPDQDKGQDGFLQAQDWHAPINVQIMPYILNFIKRIKKTGVTKATFSKVEITKLRYK